MGFQVQINMVDVSDVPGDVFDGIMEIQRHSSYEVTIRQLPGNKTYAFWPCFNSESMSLVSCLCIDPEELAEFYAENRVFQRKMEWVAESGRDIASMTLGAKFLMNAKTNNPLFF